MGYGQQGAAFGMQQGGGFGSTGMSPMRPAGSQQAKPDLSAFDSLMDSSQKPKVPMNQMSSTSNQSSARPTGFNQPQPMGMMMGSMGMQGNSMGMGGNPMSMGGNSMGMNPMGMGSPVMGMPTQQPGFGAGRGGGAFGQMGMGGMQGQSSGFGGQMMTPTNNSMQPQKSTNSLDDLLG